MAQLDPADDDVRHFYRMIMLWAFNTETDDTGKIQIPTGLMRFAGLTQDALILGAFDHVEVWDPGRFDAYLDRAAPDYEALAGRILGC
jgi:MraZ protein